MAKTSTGIPSSMSVYKTTSRNLSVTNSVSNEVNYKDLYGSLRTCLGDENKEKELNKNVLPCLAGILSVFVCCILAF